MDTRFYRAFGWTPEQLDDLHFLAYYQILEALDYLDQVEQINHLNHITLAIAAGNGDKKAFEQIKKQTESLSRSSLSRSRSEALVSIPLSEIVVPQRSVQADGS